MTLKALALTLLSSVFVSGLAQAETVKCYFTEPFISIDVDVVSKTLTFLDAIENKSTNHAILEQSLINGVQRVVWGPGDDKSVLEYRREPQGGSDGMSDFLYPYTGETWTGDSHRLIGGCATTSEPAINPSEAAFPGCYEVMVGQYEDGSALYKAINELILQPLAAQQKTKGLATFLESAMVTHGYLGISLDVCRSIDDAVR